MKKIAILQPNYLPWKGVFDMISQVDEFVFLDDVKYTKQDWRNRNRILTQKGAQWIVVPVEKFNVNDLILEIKICNKENWRKKHYNLISYNYSKAKYFKEYKWILDEIYKREWNMLSELDIFITKLICEVLDIKTTFIHSTELKLFGIKDDRTIKICRKLGATHYLSGPAAKNYIIPEKFDNAEIALEYIEYEYPEYKQVYEPFEHAVTVLDVIFNCGPDAPYYIYKK